MPAAKRISKEAIIDAALLKAKAEIDALTNRW